MENRYYPTIWQSIFLIFICFNLQLLGGMIYAYTFSSKFPYTSGMLFVFSFIPVLLTILIGLRFSNTTLKEYFPRVRCSVFKILNVLFLVIGAYILILSFNMLLYKYIQGFRNTPEVLLNAYTSIIGILYITIAGPIGEEILFRGIILSGLLKSYSPLKSIAVSSILFGFLHFNIVQSLVTTVLGLMLGFILVKTGSLWVCIISHILYNSLTILSPGMLLFYNEFTIILPILSVAGTVIISFAIYNLSRMHSNISDFMPKY